MSLDPFVLLAIAGMAVATFACRAGGYLLFRSVRTPPVVRAALGYIPGALFVSYVVPALAAGGPQEWTGAVATAALMLTTRHLSLAILGGTAAAWVIWTLR